MVVVGLTGGIGAGKSTVASLLARRGAGVIDVDALGREVLRRGRPAFAPVLARFGPGVLGGDGEIDRAKLAVQVFGHPDELAALTSISHPAINEALAARLATCTSLVVVLDMAVLVESSLGRGLYQVVVVVEAPWPLRLVRLEARGLSEHEALARRDAQASDEQRRAVATRVIQNDGDLAALERAVGELWRELTAPQTP